MQGLHRLFIGYWPARQAVEHELLKGRKLPVVQDRQLVGKGPLQVRHVELQAKH